MYGKRNIQFDTKVNKAQYYINWSLIIYSTFKAKKNIIKKTKLKILLIFTNKL